MKKKITINPKGINNFHNCAPINVIVGPQEHGYPLDFSAEHVYYISKRQAREIERHFCGITGCCCPAGGVVIQLDPEGTEWGLRVSDQTD